MSCKKISQKIEKEKIETEKQLREITELKKALKESQEKTEAYKAKILDNARAEATDILLSAEETAKQALEKLKKQNVLNI